MRVTYRRDMFASHAFLIVKDQPDRLAQAVQIAFPVDPRASSGRQWPTGQHRVCQICFNFLRPGS